MRTHARKDHRSPEIRRLAEARSIAPRWTKGDAGLRATGRFGQREPDTALPPGAGFDFGRVSAYPSGPVEQRTMVNRIPVRAAIARGRSASTGDSIPSASMRNDSPPGAEHGGEQYRAWFQQLGAAEGASAAAVPGTPGAAEAPLKAPPAPQPTTAVSPESTAAGSATPAAETAQEAAPTPSPGTATPETQSAEAPTPEAQTPATTSQPASAATGEGPAIRLPDIEIPALAAIGKSDAIASAFGYSGSITRGGAGPTGFGVTRSFGSSLTGITITPVMNFFIITATVEHPITYQVRTSVGPDGQVDIASSGDSDITAANYPTVVSDLTPNMSDLNGRPPRTQFWCEDLTLRHEKVHADDDHANGPGAVATVQAWLNGQTAANLTEVNTLLGRFPGRFADALLAALSTEDGEKHAYGDGALSYSARALAIQVIGNLGGYP